jgi:hypothetical protein
MSNDLVALIRQRRSIEKVALPISNLYNTASTALANRGINPLGTLVGGTVGAVSGAVKGYKNAEEGNKLKGAIAGGLAGGAGGALLGHTVHQSAKNLKGTMSEMASAKKGLSDAYGSKHEMGFFDRLKSRFSKEGREKLQQANQRFASDKASKAQLRNQHAQTLSDEKLKIQMNPNLSYDDQIKKIDDLYKSNPQGRYEIVNDKRKGALFGPVAAGLTAGAISTAGQTAFAAPDPNMVVESLKAKKNLTEQDKFIINEKMKQIQNTQSLQAPQSGASNAM